MKKAVKVVLVGLLVVIALVAAGAAVSARSPYRVWIDKAYVDYLVIARPKDAPCYTYMHGYNVSVGHDDTCHNCIVYGEGGPFWMEVPTLWEQKRVQRWFPMLDPQVGDYACLGWTCYHLPFIYYGYDCERVRAH